MISIRAYDKSDAESVGRLIADTYGEFNLDFASPEDKAKLLGPFQFAQSTDVADRLAIAQAIRASMVFVAEDEGEIVGVLRGRKERIQSLFVRGDYHRRGIGRQLVERCEQECIHQGRDNQGRFDASGGALLSCHGIQADHRHPQRLEL